MPLPDDLPPPVFAGFFAKKTAPAPPEHAALGVTEIAAVAHCISPAPADWIDAWTHNDHGFYDSEELARSVVPEGAASDYDLYAYEVVPVEYAETIEPLEYAAAPGAVPGDYEFLGYDIATASASPFLECSPLSCNMGAKQFPVNRYCLITNLRDAWNAFMGIGDQSTGYEPEPYYLVAVYRKRRNIERAGREARPSC